MKEKYFILILLFFLVLTRFFDFSVFYKLVKDEFIGKGNFEGNSVQYIFGGFSVLSSERSKILLEQKSFSQDIIVLSYFDLFHPIVFLVYNKNEKINTSILWCYCPEGIQKGLTEAYTYKFELYKIVQNDKSYISEACVLGLPFEKYSSIIDVYDDSGDWKGVNINSFCCYGLHILSGLKKIYYFYFYVPLLLITVLSFFFGRSFLVAYLYFVEMIILFPIKYFVVFPIWNLISFSMNQNSMSPDTIILLIASVFFLSLITVGFLNRKKIPPGSFQKILILYFILLPILLRF